MSAAISTAGLTRAFGDVVAVRDVDLQVHRGELFGLLGANGAGKTTLIRLLCGIYRPSGGRALVLGLDTRERARELHSRIGYMSQRFSLYGELTVEENLRFYGAVYEVRNPKPVQEVCEQVGLTPAQRHVRADSLPTGIRQRVALAAAIAHEPELLFLDEPTSGVDPRAREVFWALIRQLTDAGTTVVVSTHAMVEAEACSRVGMMAAGRMIATGSPQELIERTGQSIVSIESRRWRECFEALRRHWPDDCALYGRRVHVATQRPDEVERAIRGLGDELDITAVHVQRPTLEDAFVWHVERERTPALV